MIRDRADLRRHQRHGEGASQQEQRKRTFRPAGNTSQSLHGDTILSESLIGMKWTQREKRAGSGGLSAHGW